MDSEVYRAVDALSWPEVSGFLANPLATRLMDEGRMTRTRVVQADSEEQARLASMLPGWKHFVWHERVPVISYPYEWSCGMLQQAALLTLDVQIRLLKAGFSLKDASAFNIQWVDGKPVFIDIPSVERPARLDIWVAYSQFCRMFINPMALMVFRGVPFAQCFTSNLDGIDVDLTYSLLGRLTSMRPALFIDVFLQQLLSRGGASRQQQLRQDMEKRRGTADAQLLNLSRLRRLILWLGRRIRGKGHWSSYEQTHTYLAEARGEKEGFVELVLKDTRPATVLDLGCNTGIFSYLAAKNGARVISVDQDHDCIENLQERVARDGMKILPLVQNLSNPSPGLGFLNGERKAFLERAPSDCVLALALVHHLLVAARIPLPGIVDLMARLTTRDLVVEYVDPKDTMFQTLLALRQDLYQDLTLDSFKAVFAGAFHFVKERPIAGTRRTLLHFSRKPVEPAG